MFRALWHKLKLLLGFKPFQIEKLRSRFSVDTLKDSLQERLGEDIKIHCRLGKLYNVYCVFQSETLISKTVQKNKPCRLIGKKSKVERKNGDVILTLPIYLSCDGEYELFVKAFYSFRDKRWDLQWI